MATAVRRDDAGCGGNRTLMGPSAPYDSPAMTRTFTPSFSTLGISLAW